MGPLPSGVLLLLLLTTASLSGCAGGPEVMPQPRGLDPSTTVPPLGSGAPCSAGPEPDAGQRASEAATATVYSFRGAVRGASPPDFLHDGPALPGNPPAMVQSFEAPAGTVALEFELHTLEGSGMGRIEVRDGEGRLVHTSSTWYSVQDPVAAGGGRNTLWTAPHAAPGKHTVNYYVAGLYDLGFRAIATVAPGGDGDGDGDIDFPTGPGCSSAAHGNQTDPATPAPFFMPPA